MARKFGLAQEHTIEETTMRGIRFTSQDIAKHIRAAGDTCLLVIPGVDTDVAEALIDRAQRSTTTASVVIDGSHHAERCGYGETATWHNLMVSTELRTMPGTRLGVLVTNHGAWLFAPRAGKLDPRGEEGLSAVALDTNWDAAQALVNRILGHTAVSPQKHSDERAGTLPGLGRRY